MTEDGAAGTYVDELLLAFVFSAASLVLEDDILVPSIYHQQRSIGGVCACCPPSFDNCSTRIQQRIAPSDIDFFLGFLLRGSLTVLYQTLAL